MPKKFSRAFTLVELVIVMAVLGVLVAITYSVFVSNNRERTYLNRANGDLSSMSNALKLSVAKYNDYPAEADRTIPPTISEFLQQSGINTPTAPWPDSIYDYDRWDDLGVIQFSVHFCNAGDNATCKTKAARYLKGFVADSVLANWDSYSSVYYCIKGNPCRSHVSKPVDHPGYCINCSGAAKFY